MVSGRPAPGAGQPVSEVRVPGPVPRFEVPEWRAQFGVVAGITGRGEGPDPYDLGLWTEQPVGRVMTRWREFRSSEPGFPGAVMAHQVHGNRVLRHGAAEGWVIHSGADGHASASRGVMLLVTVADCIPVYLMSPGRGAVALLHAGWRGTAAGILGAGIEALTGLGSIPSDIVMHCGVGICGLCYEVGSEVAGACGLPADGAGPWHVDLRSVLVDQARKLGVTRISTSQLCSAHLPDLFFSHRASGGKDGRMVAYLGMPDMTGGG